MPRKISDLTDEELESERKRRRAASRPKKVRVYEMDEETFSKHFGKSQDDDESSDDGDEDDEDDSEDEEEPTKKGYFK